MASVCVTVATSGLVGSFVCGVCICLSEWVGGRDT